MYVRPCPAVANWWRVPVPNAYQINLSLHCGPADTVNGDYDRIVCRVYARFARTNRVVGGLAPSVLSRPVRGHVRRGGGVRSAERRW